MIKEKKDYPLVLTTKHVQEIMECGASSASVYIREASAYLKKQGKLAPLHVVRNGRIPRDLFFEVYGI
ncbi:MAG: hypothetical protein Q3980_17030 [Turicibacter sp.]|nr:hypothetical protein [Turicibacter sp.]